MFGQIQIKQNKTTKKQTQQRKNKIKKLSQLSEKPARVLELLKNICFPVKRKKI